MSLIGQGVEICTSTTRPTNAVVGTMIYETDTASYRWCSAVSPSIVWTGMIPVGTVQPFAGSVEPPGWLFCFGQSLNASTSPQYADLFSVLNTTYGGTGVTAFNVPDLRGRSIFGKDNMGGTAQNRITTGNSGVAGTTLGASGGDERLHQHLHSVSITSGGMSANESHVHSQVHATGGGAQTGLQASGIGLAGQTANYQSVTSTNLAHTHSVSGNTANTGAASAQNMPPTIILNYIIKF